MSEILNINKQNEIVYTGDEENEQFTLSKIKEITDDITINFIRLGGYLDDAKRFCTRIFYEKKGRPYKNVYEWAEDKLGYKPTTTKNLINICNRFGECKTMLKKEYRDFSYSQLLEMLPIPDKFISNEFITPEMSKRDIIAFKKTMIEKTGQPVDQKTDSQAPKGKESILTFKNDTDRTKFLQDYKSWGLWFSEERLGLKYYRCMFSNGDYIVVTLQSNYKYLTGDILYEHEPSPVYCVIRAGTSPKTCRYSLGSESFKELLHFMKQPGLKAILDFWGDKQREIDDSKKHTSEIIKTSAKDINMKKQKIKKSISKEMKYYKALNGGD